MTRADSFRTGVAGAAAWAALALASQGAAQPIRAVGQVLALRPEATSSVLILRRDGHRVAAHPFDLLYAGDSVTVEADGASVDVFDVGSRSARRIRRADGVYALAGGAPGGAGEAYVDYFRRGFAALFNTPRKPLPVETEARGQATAPPLRADSLLPEGRQFMPRGSTDLAVFWRGGAAAVTLSGRAGRGEPASAPGPLASAILRLEPLREGLRITVGAKALVWTVEVADPADIPVPPWAAGRPPGSDPERLVRAAWLLREGPATWRLFAVSEIATLSRGNYAADRLWQAIRAGDFETPAIPGGGSQDDRFTASEK